MAHAFRPNTLRMMATVGQVETCEYETEDKHGALSFDVFDACQLDENGVTLFRGDIDEVSVRSYDSPYNIQLSGATSLTPVGARIWSIKAQGLTHLAYRLLTQQFSASPRTPIALTVATIAGALGIAVSISTYPSDLAFPDVFLTDQEMLASAFTRIANLCTALSGIPHIWRIVWTSGNPVFQFTPVTSVVGNYAIGPTGYQPRTGSVSIRRTREQFANWVVLKLDRYLREDPITVTFDGSNVQLGYVGLTDGDGLPLPLAGQPTISVAGFPPQTVGVYGLDANKDWYWSLGSPLIRLGNTDFTTHDVGTLTAPMQRPSYVTAKNTASINAIGPFQVPIGVGDSNNAMSPADQANSELIRRSYLTTIVKCQVRCPPNAFIPGQLVSVSIDVKYLGATMALTPSGYFYLVSVRQFDEDGVIVWRELELVQGPQLYRANQFIQRLGR